MKNISIFLAALLMAGCSSMGMSGGSDTSGGDASYGTSYGSGIRPLGPNNPGSPYYGD